MRHSTRTVTTGAAIAALYTVLTYLQNFLLPNTTSGDVQLRVSEALCVLALFTPAAIPGLTVGCFLSNIYNIGSLPLDVVFGTLASLAAAAGMWCSRKICVKGFPLLAMLLPALANGVIVGAELTICYQLPLVYTCAGVALGEVAVLLTLGSALYYAIRGRTLERVLCEG
ncbi:MAG: QueT transporter family protein [Firmicutes bacterium]|nr:QueT transporter family protein [Bacillota bacterium]